MMITEHCIFLSFFFFLVQTTTIGDQMIPVANTEEANFVRGNAVLGGDRNRINLGTTNSVISGGWVSE
jgi:hypothetical protein